MCYLCSLTASRSKPASLLCQSMSLLESLFAVWPVQITPFADKAYVQQSKVTLMLVYMHLYFKVVIDHYLNGKTGRTNNQAVIGFIISVYLPPANEVGGRWCFHRYLSVILSTGGGYLWFHVLSGGWYLWYQVLSQGIGISGTRCLAWGGGYVPGNGFIQGWVCLVGWVCRGGGVRYPAPLDMVSGIQKDTVGKWVVCILRECFLVGAAFRTLCVFGEDGSNKWVTDIVVQFA